MLHKSFSRCASKLSSISRNPKNSPLPPLLSSLGQFRTLKQTRHFHLHQATASYSPGEVPFKNHGAFGSGLNNFNSAHTYLSRRTMASESASATAGPLGEPKTSIFGPMGRSIEVKIRKEFTGETDDSLLFLELVDCSHEHRGHAGVRNSTTQETHFRIRMVSDQFDGLSRVKRHQKVMGLLKEEFDLGLHSLELWVKTPKEAGY